MKDKILLGATISVAMILALVIAGKMGVFLGTQTLRGVFPQQSSIAKAHASTTSYALVGNAVATRIVATSTRMDATDTLPATSGRMGITLQTVNCAALGQVWLSFNDVPATTTTGFSLAASSTLTLSDTLPSVYGSIRASASSANCRLNVTEWRSEN